VQAYLLLPRNKYRLTHLIKLFVEPGHFGFEQFMKPIPQGTGMIISPHAF
jgi:hypothetical protein